jgi:DNA repair protein RAD50
LYHCTIAQLHHCCYCYHNRAEDAAISADLSPIERQLESTQQVSASASSLLSRWTDITERMKDLKARKQRHESSVSQSLGTATENRSYQQIEEDRRSRDSEREHLRQRKDTLTEEENRISKQYQSLKLLVSEAEKSFLTAQGLEKRQDELEGRLAELSSRENEILEELAKVNRSISSAERDVSTSDATLNSDRAKMRKDEGQVQSKTLSLRGELDVLTRAVGATDEQTRRVASKTPSADILRELEEIQHAIAEKEALLKEYQPKMNAIHSKITHQEQVKKVVQDNITYRTTCKELDARKAEYAEKRAQAIDMDASGGDGGRNRGKNSAGGGVGDLGARYLAEKQREVQRTEQEHQRLADTRANLSGRLSTLREQTLEYDVKLNGPQFKAIDERCRRKNIECETTQMACTDLDSYYNALDRALLNFHTLKIKEVNKIIKELWQLIYRGEDIDMIEIVSGIEAAEGSGAPSGGRADKSFNYRVVMKKGNYYIGYILEYILTCV